MCSGNLKAHGAVYRMRVAGTHRKLCSSEWRCPKRPPLMLCSYSTKAAWPELTSWRHLAWCQGTTLWCGWVRWIITDCILPWERQRTWQNKPGKREDKQGNAKQTLAMTIWLVAIRQIVQCISFSKKKKWCQLVFFLALTHNISKWIIFFTFAPLL